VHLNAALRKRGVRPSQIAAIVTDNPSVMKRLRQSFIEQDGHQHILQSRQIPHRWHKGTLTQSKPRLVGDDFSWSCRCWFHAFGTISKSVISHPHAQRTITKAQKIVTYFRASPPAWAKLQAHARGSATPMLQSSNQTRMTSVHMCLASVLRLEGAFRSLLQDEDHGIRSEIIDILNDINFWRELQLLNKILEPFSEVTMAIQGRHSTLADVTRYMLFLRNKLDPLIPMMPQSKFMCKQVCLVVLMTSLLVCSSSNKRGGSRLCRIFCSGLQ
jgi:hypothetical protein